MEKSLRSVQTIAKIAKVVALILFIIICFGALLSLVGVFVMPSLTAFVHNAIENIDFSLSGDVAEIFGEYADSIGSFFDQGILDKFLSAALCLAFVSLAAVAVVTFLAYFWFRREIADGTPFTHRFAADMKRLGTIMLVVDLGLPIILSIAAAIVFPAGTFRTEYNATAFDGLIFIVIGAICKYGACLADRAKADALPASPADNGDSAAE